MGHNRGMGGDQRTGTVAPNTPMNPTPLWSRSLRQRFPRCARRGLSAIRYAYTQPIGITMRIRIARCRSATTPIQLRDCHTSMNTTCQSMKSRTSSVDRFKTYADVMILALRSVRLERDDIKGDLCSRPRSADSVFIITAYELGPKAKRAIRRRRRRKR